MPRAWPRPSEPATSSEGDERVPLAGFPADIELADAPVTRVWQLAGIAPLGALDQLTLQSPYEPG